MTKSKSQVLKEIEDLLRGYDVGWDIPAEDDMVFSLPESILHNIVELSLTQQKSEMIEWAKGRKVPKHCNCKAFPCDLHHHVGDDQVSGFNRALDDVIEQLKK